MILYVTTKVLEIQGDMEILLTNFSIRNWEFFGKAPQQSGASKKRRNRHPIVKLTFNLILASRGMWENYKTYRNGIS